jgi:hypothetical protein
MRNTLGERELDKFVESPTRSGKSAVEVVVSSENGILATEKIALSITSVNTWTPVPVAEINNIATIETFDEFDAQKIILDWRIVGGVSVQVRSANLITVTVHVIGYKN